MKKLFLLLIFLNLINCQKDGSPKESIFDSQKLPQLYLQDVGSFWDDDSIKHISDYMGAYFVDHSGFLDGVGYYGDKNIIVVSVFKSQADAIQAMELRRNNVAAIIDEGGKHELINGKWWFAKGPSNAIFVNQLNTIMEVAYYYPAYDELEEILIETAVEIARRIDSLSN
ncbi:hypothetical protein H8E88_18610 [candidate division KSB1 bacterium]|nr:hypothetical protein [candidate division KSB1 bacterium]